VPVCRLSLSPGEDPFAGRGRPCQGLLRTTPCRIVALGLVALSASAQVAVLTYQYDNSRAGSNLNEAILAPANVNPTQFGKLFSYPVDGYVYAQPLYVPNVAMPGKGTHNVVFVATEHDSVYAFDADSNAGTNSAPLWHTSFLNSAAGVTTFPAGDTGCDQIVPEIGITGTPVIDPQTGTLYAVGMTKETAGSGASYVARLHALDIASGAEKPAGPAVIGASVPGTGEGGTTVTFQARNYKQRPGLLFLNGVVYTAWSSHCDIGQYHGWLIGYDAQTLSRVAVYNNTPNGNEGSFWAGGAAPAADSAGNIYLVAGNGSFDYASGGPNLGESYIKLSSAGGLAVADYFTPFNYADLNGRDLDVGSAGVSLLPDEAGSALHPHLMVGAGKEGRIYLLDRSALGGLHSGSDSQIAQSIPSAIGGLFGNPAYYGKNIYFCGANDRLKAFAVINGEMTVTPGSQSAATMAYPGCVPTISANGPSGGIVWIVDPSGLLRAYDAAGLANELYNSNQNRARDSLGAAVKFSVPTVANGKVYAGTQNSLAVYGPLSPPSRIAIANAASGDTSAIAPGSLFSIYGSELAGTTATSGFPLPALLADVSVAVNGSVAPLLYVSPGQVNAQAPYAVASGSAVVTLMRGGLVVATSSVAIQPAAPGLFLLTGGHAAVLNPDNSINTPSRPAAAGSIVSAYLTGLGAVQPALAEGIAAPVSPLSRVSRNVTASINGVDAPVQFAGLAPGYAGLYQVNVQTPQLAPGDYPLAISLGGVISNAAPVSIR